MDVIDLHKHFKQSREAKGIWVCRSCDVAFLFWLGETADDFLSKTGRHLKQCGVVQPHPDFLLRQVELFT